MSKNHFFLFLATLLALLPFSFLFSLPSNKAYLIACNVGEGDAILITQKTTQILIDGGPNNKVLDCLAKNMPFYDREIELIINTHPEKDHLTGLIDVFDRYQVKQLITNNLTSDSEVYKAFSQKVKQKNIPTFSPQKGDSIKIANLELISLWPDKKVLGEATAKTPVNETGLVFQLKSGSFDVLLTADIDSQVEEQLIKENNFQDIEVLKIAHHASKYSSSEEFLKAVHPQIAIISVGKNSYGHPTQEVLERLQSLGIKILRTDKEEIKISLQTKKTTLFTE